MPSYANGGFLAASGHSYCLDWSTNTKCIYGTAFLNECHWSLHVCLSKPAHICKKKEYFQAHDMLLCHVNTYMYMFWIKCIHILFKISFTFFPFIAFIRSSFKITAHEFIADFPFWVRLSLAVIFLFPVCKKKKKLEACCTFCECSAPSLSLFRWNVRKFLLDVVKEDFTGQ